MVPMETMTDFSFFIVFLSAVTVQNFITIKWQEKKLSIIKIFKVFVPDHLNTNYCIPIQIAREICVLIGW